MKLYPTSIKGILIALVRATIVFYVLAIGTLWMFQEKLIFIPQSLATDFQYRFGQPFEERWLNLHDSKINTLLFKQPNSPGVILYFHGNAGSLDDWGNVAQDLSSKSGWDVWIVDYPGYGKSEGKISSEDDLNFLATIFWKTADAEYKNKKIVIYGRSIGTGIATKLASKNKSAGLILESPYFSLASLAQEKFPWLPISSLLKFKFRSDQWIQSVSSPILILHGANDEIIPMSQGERLSKLSPSVELVTVESGRHNDLGSFPKYWTSLLAWLQARSSALTQTKEMKYSECTEDKDCVLGRSSCGCTSLPRKTLSNYEPPEILCRYNNCTDTVTAACKTFQCVRSDGRKNN